MTSSSVLEMRGFGIKTRDMGTSPKRASVVEWCVFWKSCLKLVSVLLYNVRKKIRKNISLFSCINPCFLPTILAGGPPQQGPPPSGPGGMPGPPGAMGAPTRGPPPPRPPLMPPGGMYAVQLRTLLLEQSLFENCKIASCLFCNFSSFSFEYSDISFTLSFFLSRLILRQNYLII